MIDAVFEIRAEEQHRRDHQLRHGADAARYRRSQADGARRRARSWRGSGSGDRRLASDADAILASRHPEFALTRARNDGCYVRRARMQHRPIARRSARSVEGGVSSMASRGACVRRAIAGRRPPQRPALHDQKALARPPAPSRRRQRSSGIGSGCSRFVPPVQPLAVQHRVDLWRARSRDAVARFPGRAKPVGVVAAAEEAGAVPGREAPWPRRERTARSSCGRPSPRAAGPGIRRRR